MIFGSGAVRTLCYRRDQSLAPAAWLAGGRKINRRWQQVLAAVLRAPIGRACGDDTFRMHCQPWGATGEDELELEEATVGGTSVGLDFTAVGRSARNTEAKGVRFSGVSRKT